MNVPFIYHAHCLSCRLRDVRDVRPNVQVVRLGIFYAEPLATGTHFSGQILSLQHR